jgi:hypothetical protein
MRQFGAAMLTRVTWHTWSTTFESARGISRNSPYWRRRKQSKMAGSPSKRSVDLLAIDRRRAEIGLPPLEDDIQRRARGEQLSAAGANRADPWPG